jgi:formylglycine-generating enzyme required for sulfatase activity
MLRPGTRPVADYQMVRLLGRGGFGEVWKAVGPGGFAVALKFVRLEARAGALELRSLELMKDIRHPHLLGMFGAWQRDDFLILAMELADQSLHDRWQQTQKEGLPGIPFDELLEYLREAAKGIDHLNAIGIQHRDIKPQNLLLAGGGVKVADFGLAKLLEHSLTSNTGAMTPAYAAPEFLNGQTSSQSDQYALAVSYCQLRGGRLPFEGTPAQVMTGHLLGSPDLTMLPGEEQAAVARALAKKPHERWPSCRAFAEAVAASTSGARPAPRPARRRSRSGAAREAAPLPSTVPLGKRPAEVTNSLGMKLVLIPAGRFLMGSPREEKDRTKEEEQHPVQTRPFYLGVYEVTQEEYAKVMGSNPSWFAPGGGGKDKVKGLDTRRFPVEMVSWHDAVEFCRKLSALPAEQQASRVYRLPTEAEWERACRSGASSSTPFPFGASLSSQQANFDGDRPYGGAARGPYLRRTTAVGSYPPNAFGLYDMHGNVFEWCQDRIEPDACRYGPGQDSPGPHGELRVLRGGSWSYAGSSCRSAYRTGAEPGHRNGNVGFRVACDVPPATA